jgi:hypothetical protein
LPDIKLTIGVPTAGRVCMGFAYSLVGMVSKLAAHGLPTVPEATVECTMDVVESSVIHTNREKIVARAIENGRTHLMFLDDDMVFEPQVLEIMLGRRQHVVAVNYLIKSELRFPIMANTSFGEISGAFFYDGGAVKLTQREFEGSYRDSAGAALRIGVAGGILVSLEYGFKLTRRTWDGVQESPGSFHLSIGTF